MRYFKTKQIAVLATTGMILIITLHTVGFFSVSTNVFSKAFFYISHPIRQVGVELNFFVRNKFSSCSQVKIELEKLQMENSKLRTLAVENAALKTALSFKDKVSEQIILARVIATSTDVTNSGLVIDRGAKDGLKSGQPVIVDDGIILGKIDSVRQNSATVLLLTDSLSRLAVSVQEGSGTSGVLEGDRGLSMKISLIPQDEVISSGDVVVTSGLEAGIKRGIMVGTVEKIYQNNQEAFKTAIVDPFSAANYPIFVQVLVMEDIAL